MNKADTAVRPDNPPRKTTTPAAPPALLAAPVVSLRGVGKAFGSFWANKNISLDIRPGEIKALLGENGAGKSTLMNILSGRYRPTAGSLYVDGRPTRFSSPKDADRAGIGMVHQHFMLVDNMTVAENVMLGRNQPIIKPKAVLEEVGRTAEQYGLEVDPAARPIDLSMGERQNVEILKLLHRRCRILIFDEPTAVLTPGETERLIETFRIMAGQGKSVVFISHKLDETLAVAHSAAILRRGRIVNDLPLTPATSKEELACRMVGRDVVFSIRREPAAMGEEALRIESLESNGLRVRQGEVTAVVGVAGNGQKELVETIVGLRPPASGRLTVLGRSWKEFHAAAPAVGGLAWIPEDRMSLAALPDMDIVDNLLLTTRKVYADGLFLRKSKLRQFAQSILREYNVAARGVDDKAGGLSGGNMQKLVLAREFSRDPRLIVAEQPTQGLDVTAAEEIRKRLLQVRRSAGILLVTGDLEEAFQLADTIAVMFGGRFMDVFPADDADKASKVGSLMAGLQPDRTS